MPWRRRRQVLVSNQEPPGRKARISSKVDFRSSENLAGNGFRTPRQFIEAVFCGI
jgi:hypothetical protein